MTAALKIDADRAAAIARLREIYPVGSTVHTVIRYVSASGMTRAISVISPDLDDISHLVARATGNKIHPKHYGIRVTGCGMDMAFGLVYELGRVLYPDYVRGDMVNRGYALSHRAI